MFRKNNIFLLLVLTVIISCKRDSSENINTNYDPAFYIMHGRYTLIKAESNTSLDLNNDLITSKNLLNELNELYNSKLEVRIPKNLNGTNHPIFDWFWPEQYIIVDGKLLDIDRFDSKTNIHYLIQSIPRRFTYSRTDSTLILQENPYKEKSKKWSLPHLVKYNSSTQEINISVKKEILTYEGWKNVDLFIVYKKITSEL